MIIFLQVTVDFVLSFFIEIQDSWNLYISGFKELILILNDLNQGFIFPNKILIKIEKTLKRKIHIFGISFQKFQHTFFYKGVFN